ncbi:hypothetical protein [Mucisphaera sp.]|uniref:hypothetical protein n=1 Tax=Mucisphaera sp. TaxID=2913024 RepID=UPI003D0DD51E
MPELAMSPLLLNLAWRPFLDPLSMESVWLWLLIPLSLAVALVYKAIKMPTLDRLVPESLFLGFQILLGMVAVAAALWILTEIA